MKVRKRLQYHIFVTHGYLSYAELLVYQCKRVLLHQLGVSPPASLLNSDAKQHHLIVLLLTNSWKCIQVFCVNTNHQTLQRFIYHIPLFLIKSEAVYCVVVVKVVYISAENIQCSVEELVLLCAQCWTLARGNLRMAGAAKPRSPSRVEI